MIIVKKDIKNCIIQTPTEGIFFSKRTMQTPTEGSCYKNDPIRLPNTTTFYRNTPIRLPNSHTFLVQNAINSLKSINYYKTNRTINN